MELLVDAEPVLGCRVVSDPARPYFERLDAARRCAIVTVADAAAYSGAQQSVPSPAVGPQLAVVHWPAAAGSRLWLSLSDIAGGQAAEATGGRRRPCVPGR